MNKGDKFIVVDNNGTAFKKGIVVTFDRVTDCGLQLTSNCGLTQLLDPDQIKPYKPLDRFPCDDEQPN